jgi:hypothetical protein
MPSFLPPPHAPDMPASYVWPGLFVAPPYGGAPQAAAAMYHMYGMGLPPGLKLPF